jgi:threonine dehydratase
MSTAALPLRVTGWRCAACGTELPIDTVMPWRCPNGDDRRHVLQIVSTPAPFASVDDPNPFVAFGHLLAWRAFAEERGMSAARCDALTRELDSRVASVAGTGFVRTPFARSSRLSDTLGFSSSGGVWVKDETHAVGGSHKARHLFTILLHLAAAEEMGLVPWATLADRPQLAIASCGNAAIAASTLAAAADWPITVFVPPWASASVVSTLDGLGASLQVCPRLDGDPPGDPCIHRFREAVAAGAVPFSVQGPENALCLDGGRTIGWEMIDELGRDATGRGLDRVVVQVGGGAFAASVGSAFATSGIHPALHAVQTQGCAPLARAWEHAGALPGGRAVAAQHWGECMWPWEQEPHSLADGILDDETYDWIGVVAAMAADGGAPVVVPEALVEEAARIGPELTGIDVSPTGAAGLAGLLALRDQVADDERVAVVFSGVRR